jgi:hypothetical protein
MGVWLGGEGEVAGVVPSPAGEPGAKPLENFLKINIENLRFKSRVYAVFMYF